MRVPLFGILRRLDRQWLLNHPVLWIMRLHWMVYLWLLGLGLICLVAAVLPVSLQTVTLLNTYFWAALALAGLAVSPWVYFQARFAPQLRLNSQARTAAYQLAGYLFIFGIYLVWPYTLVGIKEAQISNMVSERELQKALHSLTSDTAIQQLESIPIFKGVRASTFATFDPVTAKITRITVPPELVELLAIKGIEPDPSVLPFLLSDYRQYKWPWVVLGTIILLPALILRLFQTTDVKSLLATLFFGIAVYIALLVSNDLRDTVKFGIVLLLFSVGGYAAFYASRLRRKNFLFTMGINIFYLLLAWAPLLLRTLAKFYGYSFAWENFDFGGSRLAAYFLLGIVLLFVLTPWVHRRYQALLAKPS